MVCLGTICPELFLHSSGKLFVLLSNKAYSMCNISSWLGWQRGKATCFANGLTCKQIKAALLVTKSFLRCESSVMEGTPLLTASAKPFNIPITWSMMTLIPRFFCAMANSFVSRRANLFELENFAVQQFAEVLSPPIWSSGCQSNTICWFSSTAKAAKILTTIAVNSSSLIHSLSGWSFGRSLMQRCISGFHVYQHTCHQYRSSPEPSPMPQLVKVSCLILTSVLRSTKWLRGRIQRLVPFRFSLHYIQIYSSSVWIAIVN